MFVQSERFLEAHGGRLGDIAIYGQESNPTTRRLCAMNLAIRGIDFDLGKTHGDTFLENQHPDKRFDFILMNPPFGRNASYPKQQLLDDVRWKKYGVPQEKPANYAWMSHAIHHLGPKGRAGIVMPRGSVTSTRGGDDVIRRAFLEDDIVECIIDLPRQLFHNVQIPAVLWFLNKDKSRWKNKRDGEVLFIDARKLGSSISSTQIEFSGLEVERISSTFDKWTSGSYSDIDGFCRSTTVREILESGGSLAPGRFIGTEEAELDDEVEIGVRLTSLAEDLRASFDQSRRLEKEIETTLTGLGYGE
jgi:type I restriction enzyme M protein